MNSPDSPKNWDRLTAQARQAAAPADIDLRHAIRAEIATQAARPRTMPHVGLLDELLALGGARWLQAGLACILAGAAWSCWQGVTIVHELTILWSFQGPSLAQL
ncbi:MAG: hypothetical protein U0984_11035 [Prosthecobacter sp.]|nr:hypothetical protein [Prosthecobacter sp.]